jgi:DNA-binding winged helix-turn-helix (wHTH) protein
MPPPKRLRFGDYSLDIRSGELRRGSQVIPLEPQPARVLATLASRPGVIVTHEELRVAVWGQTTFVSFDEGLHYCIRQARRALEDDARAPRFIETVARRGYRFLPAVEARGGSAPRILVIARRGALVAAASVMLAFVALELITTGETHHRIVVAVLQTVHDFFF